MVANDNGDVAGECLSTDRRGQAVSSAHLDLVNLLNSQKDLLVVVGEGCLHDNTDLASANDRPREAYIIPAGLGQREGSNTLPNLLDELDRGAGGECGGHFDLMPICCCKEGAARI